MKQIFNVAKKVLWNRNINLKTKSSYKIKREIELFCMIEGYSTLFLIACSIFKEFWINYKQEPQIKMIFKFS